MNPVKRKKSWKAVLAAACLALPLAPCPSAWAQDADVKAKQEQAENEKAAAEKDVERLRAQIAQEEAEKEKTIEKLRTELKKESTSREDKLAEFEKKEEALRRALEIERERLGANAKLQEDKARFEVDKDRAVKSQDIYRKTLILKDANARPVLAPMKLEKAAFLGVSTSPVGAAMREQLKLPRGVGLVVEHVEKGSPAEQAGVKQYDILQKLNDQLLINSHQLSVLVRTFKAGDAVTLTIVREGKPQDVKTTLAEKDLPPVGDHDPMGMFPGRPLNVLAADGDAQIIEFPADRVHRGMAAMSRASNKMVEARVRDDLTLMLNRNGKSMTLRATDPKTKKVLFEGPIDTEEQRKTIPKNIAEELESDTFRKIFRDIEQDREVRFFVEPGGAANDVVIEFDAAPAVKAELRLDPPPAAEAAPAADPAAPPAPAPPPRK